MIDTLFPREITAPLTVDIELCNVLKLALNIATKLDETARLVRDAIAPLAKAAIAALACVIAGANPVMLDEIAGIELAKTCKTLAAAVPLACTIIKP